MVLAQWIMRLRAARGAGMIERHPYLVVLAIILFFASANWIVETVANHL